MVLQSLRTQATSALDHQRFSSLINSMTDGVIAIDHQQKIIEYNGAALNVLDSNRSIMGEHLSSVLHPINAQDHPVDVAELLRNTKIPTVHRDFRLQYKDKSLINLYMSIAPVRSGYGQSERRGYIVMLRDITREKSLEEERDEFISVVSHELRTPVAIVEGNVSNAMFVAEHKHDPALILQSLHAAYDQVVFLAGLINDLAMLSRAEHGKVIQKSQPVNIVNLVTMLTPGYREQCEKKGLAFKVELDPALEIIHSDELYVREILQNFITNAIKYTDKGSITLHAKQKSEAIEFKVEDTGIGISKSDQEKIFGKFFRSEDYRTRKTNGTGLGLYVTRKLADMLQATITVQSTLNEGSVFTILVPDLKTKSAKHPKN